MVAPPHLDETAQGRSVREIVSIFATSRFPAASVGGTPSHNDGR
jgi:hypothetical protein